MLPNAAHAQVVLTAADSNTGAAGAPGVSQSYPSPSASLGDTEYVGYSGGIGYSAPGGSYILNGPSFTGGSGGSLIAADTAGWYRGGPGGDGLDLSGTNAVINSGIFTGGIGGSVSGTGKTLGAGPGGEGLKTGLSPGPDNSVVSIYGGQFRGGDSGSASGTAGFGFGSDGAGIGLFAYSGTVNIYGGSFTGGNSVFAQDVFNTQYAYDNPAGNGLYNFGANVNIFGGTFTEGKNGFGDILVRDGSTTLYGSFIVNGVANYTGPLTGDGTITGIFQDNNTATILSYEMYGGTLNIKSPAAVPEASTTVSFGLLLALGLGGVVLARKKSAVA